MMPADMTQIIYFVGVLLIIFGFKQMSTLISAKKGVIWSAIGLLITIIITYFNHEVKSHYLLMTIAIVIGGAIGFLCTRNATLTDTPKMVTLFNSMTGATVAAIASLILIKLTPMTDIARYLTVIAVLLGAISFSASKISYLKQHGKLKIMRLPMHGWLNALLLVIAITFGIAIVLNGNQFEVSSLILLLIFAMIFGASISLPISTKDMPMALSLLIALTGLAISSVAYVISNPVMIVAGALTATTTLVLMRKISKSTNRSISSILLGEDNSAKNSRNSLKNSNIKELDENDAAMMMAFANKVIVVPGYGMANAQAQSELSDINKRLNANGVNVKFAIHPVAGRMPGHMNLLLSEAEISYDSIFEINEINDEFETADVVLIIGANDVTNPLARSKQSTPITGMPILNADKASNVIIIKRGKGNGYSNIDNPLFYQDNTRLIFGDAKSVLLKISRHLKAI